LFVLDVDVKGEKRGDLTLATLEDEHGPLPETMRVSTQSGGIHYCFRYPQGTKLGNSSEKKLGPGLDTRGAGGYVCRGTLPDGRGYVVENPDQPLADVPQWLIELLLPTASHTAAAFDRENRPHNQAVKASNRYIAAAIDGELAKVVSSTEGSRNNTLNEAAFSIGQWCPHELPQEEAESMLFEASQVCGLPEGEARKTIASGLASGMKIPRQAPEPKKRKRGKAEAEALLDRFSEPTEESIASAFVAEYGDKLKFCEQLGMWFEWIPEIHVWKPDRMRRAFHYARLVAKSLNSNGKATLARASAASGVERFARADIKCATVPEQWDSESFLIGTPTGVFQL
jgi:hypothetical protein